MAVSSYHVMSKKVENHTLDIHVCINNLYLQNDVLAEQPL